jgi:two-component system phosphate regulon sensor histidine kinase PhoR
MNARALFVLLACGALLFAAAVAAALLWGAGPALAALACGAAGFLGARLLAQSGPAPHPAPAEELAASHTEMEETVTPTVARAVVTGEVPAGALLEATMDSMREGVLVIDSAMRVVASNDSVRAIFGSKRGDDNPAGPRRLSELTRTPSVYSAFAGAVARGERAEVRVEAGRGGDRRVYDLRVAPLRQREAVDGSDVRGAVGVFFDITQLERLERVRQEFLSNVSHELRTPLTAILTFIETLEDGGAEDPETARRFLSVIRRNSERMRDLINDILELSAIEAGTVAVEPARVRLAALVNDCFTSLAGRATERRVELRNEVPADAHVYADARRLEQMLTNLVDNAVKFNRDGGRVTVAHERDGGARDRITVADTGEGIPAEHLVRIFERFYRVDRARSRALGGTGLGLAIVKHLARAHGGEATVRSTPGEGTAFTIELPSHLPES